MPDLLMCESTICFRARDCFRHASSGTQPDEGQRYGEFKTYWFQSCSHYLPALNPDGSPRLHVEERWYSEADLSRLFLGPDRPPMVFLGEPPATPERRAEIAAYIAEGYEVYGALDGRRLRKARRAAKQGRK